MKLSTCFKPLILAAALAVAGAASAVVPAYEYQLPVNTSTSSIITVNEPSGSFIDTFGFTVGSASSLTGFAISADSQFLYLGSFLFTLEAVSFGPVSLSPGVLTSTVTGDASFSRVDFSAGYLAAGDYVLTVSGTTVPGIQGGSAYGIAATLAPVPEPEKYAMLLAGLGFIAAVARRKI